MPNDDQKPSSQPLVPPSPGQLQDRLPSGERSPTSQGTPEPSRTRQPSRPDLGGDDDLAATRRKDLRELVATFDKLIKPLDAILRLMQRATTFGILLLAVLAIMAAVQVHTTIRTVGVEARLDNIVETQKTLTAAATAQEQQQAQQSQITIEPAVTPSGAPTAILVVTPPKSAGSASSSRLMRPVPIALAPTTTSTVGVDASVARPSPHGSASASAVAPPPPAPPAALTVKFE